ncbi:EamA family transporter [Sneathiella sp. P13V-1]|uniref:DMT family transporter n=1 Tax=Sneathiella sp. P13V-1 TaxID=2697366 RepID=UPI00187B5C56|nr:DMT family transporter [Sneathiella sp. P13V-1]MBE7637812.1 EamA family transporter [Sneathiella sp. P13V-1]
MELWIPITIAAAFFQNVRTALQKHLAKNLTTGGATYIRFLYGVPFAFIYIFGLHEVGNFPFYTPNLEFFTYVIIGGTTQILATAFLVKLFSLRNFAVGTTYSKTETVQAAFIGLVLLGDSLSIPAIIAIAVSFVGIMLISVSGGKLTLKEVMLGWTGKPALYGLLSGGLFGVCAVCYRGAGLSLGGEGAIMQAATSIVWVLSFQSLIMTAYILIVERAQFMASLKAWRVAIWVGVFSLLGSIGWFTAMTLQNAAYVRAVGQIELIFTFAISYFVFKERTTLVEFAGVMLIAVGILFLVLPF